MFRVLAREAFCIFLSTSLTLFPTSFCRVGSKSLDHPSKTSMMILYWTILYPGYLCFISHLSDAYFMALSDVLLSRFLTQGQLISSSITCLCWLLLCRLLLLLFLLLLFILLLSFFFHDLVVGITGLMLPLINSNSFASHVQLIFQGSRCLEQTSFL